MKPPREWTPALCHTVAHSNTGFVGITEAKIRGRDCFRVAVRTERNRRKVTTVYYGRRGVTREAALERARKLRLSVIGARLQAEQRIVP